MVPGLRPAHTVALLTAATGKPEVHSGSDFQLDGAHDRGPAVGTSGPRACYVPRAYVRCQSLCHGRAVICAASPLQMPLAVPGYCRASSPGHWQRSARAVTLAA
jgi:hypothetical protein